MQKSDETRLTAMRLSERGGVLLAIVFAAGGFDPKTVLRGQLWSTFLRSTRFSLANGAKDPMLHREFGSAGLSDMLVLLAFMHSNVGPVHLWQFMCNFLIFCWFLLMFEECPLPQIPKTPHH